ncbi:hypothetical protein A6A29_41135 [Streptomyces sp. TSRI0281]|nr:hypothetical protein A6A29_41135 [Streptomyces sp. TSRI0281]
MEGPGTIASGWPGVGATAFAGGIDAAVLKPGQPVTFLFKGDSYLVYNLDAKRISAGPGKIAAGWDVYGSVFATGVDTACGDPDGSKNVLLLKGDIANRHPS